MKLKRGLSLCAAFMIATMSMTFVSGCSSAPEDLKVGDCFNAPDSVLTGEEHLADVSIISCDKSHNSEVIGVQILPDGAFPGDKKIAQQTFDFCTKAFEKYVGIPYEKSRYDLYPLNPSKESWERNGDRLVACVALHLPPRSDSAEDTHK